MPPPVPLNQRPPLPGSPRSSGDSLTEAGKERTFRLQALHQQVDGHRWQLDRLASGFMGLTPQDVIDVLHAHGSVISANPQGIAPIMAAATLAGDGDALALLDALVACGASVNTAARDGMTPLDQALRRPSLEVARWLLERGADVNGPPVDGRSDGARTVPLITALLGGPDGALELLLEHGANPNVVGSDQRSPLEIAVHRGRLTEAAALIAAGADATRPVARAGSLLHLAATLPGVGPDGCLWSAPSPVKGAHHSLPEAMIALLVVHGGDPSARDAKGRTPLHHTVNLNVSGSRNAMNRHRSDGLRPGQPVPMDWNATDSMRYDQRRFVAEMAESQRAWSARALIAAGADVNVQDHAGHTPLSRLIQHPPIDWDLVTALLAAGADWEIQAPNLPESPHATLRRSTDEAHHATLLTLVERIALEKTMVRSMAEASLGQTTGPRPRSRL